MTAAAYATAIAAIVPAVTLPVAAHARSGESPSRGQQAADRKAGGITDSADEPAVFIPADRRHRGLSKFDLFPFTDRQKGDPDRYRAINPNHVKKENGAYYYLLDAKPGARYFDENLKDQGPLVETNVAVDLSRVKEQRTGDGRTRRYVYVNGKGYVSRGMLTPASEVRTGKWFQFPLKSGQHRLYDGTGIALGTLAAGKVRLNYGQQKQINGERCYYAFSTSILPEGSTRKSGASGWIKASALRDGNDPQYSAEVVTKMQPPPATNAAFTEYEVTGGDPQEKTGSGPGGKPVYRFGYPDEKGNFIAYKVLPGVALAGRASVAATDYLKRNDDVINLGFNVAGVSNDTYRVSSAKRRLVFHRSHEKDATAVIDLYPPKSAANDGRRPVGKMVFVYGYVDEGGAKRWGWMALGALKKTRTRNGSRDARRFGYLPCGLRPSSALECGAGGVRRQEAPMRITGAPKACP